MTEEELEKAINDVLDEESEASCYLAQDHRVGLDGTMSFEMLSRIAKLCEVYAKEEKI